MSYLILAFVSLTAARKNIIVRGILRAKMIAVFWVPKSGCPDVSSKTEPTAAIAVMHDPANNKPLFGVMYIISAPYTIGLTAC